MGEPMKRLILLPLVFCLAGCVVDVDSRIDKIGSELYRVISLSPSSLSGIGILEDAAKHEAAEYCRQAGLRLYIVEELTTQPPFIGDNLPKAEITFKCVP